MTSARLESIACKKVMGDERGTLQKENRNQVHQTVMKKVKQFLDQATF